MAAEKDPFLRQIAFEYDRLNPGGLVGVTFVFPNRRSSLFFQKYLREAQGVRLRSFDRPFLSPATVTLDDLFDSWCPTLQADRSELLLILYASYLAVAARMGMPRQNAMDLSSFMFWGDVILADFNDIDLELADASQLLRNLKDLKSIETNPLDGEKWELVKQFWNTTGLEHLVPDDSDDASLWIDYDSIPTENDTDGHQRPAARGFFKIWQLLGPLYIEFRKQLLDRGLHYRGMAIRNLASRIRDIDDAEMSLLLHHRHLVFAGFSNLSRAEVAVLEVLRDRGVADFFWDMDQPVFGLKENNAFKAIGRLSRSFPSPFDLDVPDAMPEIKIVGVPSDIGQVKEASAIVAGLGVTPANASSTAVVLADEALCVPMLHSLDLPVGIDVNITMGYPLRLSPVASVIDSIVLMQSRARYRSDDSSATFFKEDVQKLLSHPLLMRLAPGDCTNLSNFIERLRLYNIPAIQLQRQAGVLADLFIVLKMENDTAGAFSQIRSVVSCLYALFPEKTPVPGIDEVDGSENDPPVDLWEIDRIFLQGYLDELDSFEDSLREILGDNVDYGAGSVLRSIARIMSRREVRFKGAPLRGLQVLGVDDTRSLDFDRIVALSMNERVFPRRSQVPTFIPHTLRVAYGLPTSEQRESETAYSFYRLVSRASQVWLVYNASTDGLKSGEMSRYLYQLIYAYRPQGLEAVIKNYPVGIFHPNEIKIAKSNAVMNELARFRPDAHDDIKRYFSASSIKKLLDCELGFYFEYIAGFQMPDEVKGYIDDSVYGKIVHETLECMYNHQAALQNRREGGALITSSIVRSMASDPLLDRYIRRAINHNYFSRVGADIAGEPDDLDTPLDGESTLFEALIKKSVKKVLGAEAVWLEGKYEVVYLHGEKTDPLTLKLSPGLEINFKHIIDRIDRVVDVAGTDPYLRLVDYKTGNEELVASSVERLVDYSGSADKVPHGITQLMIYCNSYSEVTGYHGRMQPYIYNFRVIAKKGMIDPLRVGPAKQGRSLATLEDYRDINDEFMDLLAARISRLFDPSEPLVQTDNPKRCKFCNFKEICNRQ